MTAPDVPPPPVPLPARSGRGTRVVAGIAVLATAWVWGALLVPTPKGVGKRDRDVFEAELKLGLYLQAQAIEQFRAKAGRLPATLAEAGAVDPAYEYAPTPGGAYTVSLRLGGGRTLEYASGTPAGDFIGSRLRDVLRAENP
ncbi:MAG: hypothetical protein NW201_00430 [Gemmatimonadales bacterium]|nr:hypothetical protein [Gemmatimonadales bacterium]